MFFSLVGKIFFWVSWLKLWMAKNIVRRKNIWYKNLLHFSVTWLYLELFHFHKCWYFHLALLLIFWISFLHLLISAEIFVNTTLSYDFDFKAMLLYLVFLFVLPQLSNTIFFSLQWRALQLMQISFGSLVKWTWVNLHELGPTWNG